MQRDDAYLLDIAIAARHLQSFTAGYDREAFFADAKTQAAVLYKITIMGEAAKRVSDEFRQQHPEIAWRDVCGMRDRVVHQYNRVNLNRVWDVASQEIPDLLRKLQPLLPREGAQP